LRKAFGQWKKRNSDTYNRILIEIKSNKINSTEEQPT